MKNLSRERIHTVLRERSTNAVTFERYVLFSGDGICHDEGEGFFVSDLHGEAITTAETYGINTSNADMVDKGYINYDSRDASILRVTVQSGIWDKTFEVHERFATAQEQEAFSAFVARAALRDVAYSDEVVVDTYTDRQRSQGKADA